MAAETIPFIGKMARYLAWPEKIFLLVFAIGMILRLSGTNANSLIMISLSGLAVIFFLQAYSPPFEIERNENEPQGFSELLTFTILPKILRISTAVATIGILFYLLDFQNQGYKQMLMIGGSSISIALVLLAFAFVTGTKQLKVFLPILIRAVPVLCLVLYIFLIESI